MDFAGEESGSDKDSELNLNILEEHFEEINVDPVLENKEQVDNLIRKYIKIIRLDCTDEVLKKRMIRKLCDLRLRQCELIEEQELNLNGENTLCGHQFKFETTTNYCDICMKRQSGIFIPILNNLTTYSQLNVCIHCNYSIHVECQTELFNKKKIRECPKLVYERQMTTTSPTKELNHRFLILDICVEKALSDQEYKCNDCKELISFENSLLCDYDGHYYCRNCHNNDMAIIPARVIHNWDFNPRLVCKNSFYILNFVKNKPILFNILELNSMLYGFIDELPIVKRLRYELNLMIKYIILCKQPSKPKITINNHLFDSEQINNYSLYDLQDLPLLKKNLTDFHSELLEHITKNCETCRGNGFYCELCSNSHVERKKEGILFPFSPNISLCQRCSAVFHKNCFYRKKTCTRCKRIQKKESESVTMEGMELKAIDTELLKSKENVERIDGRIEIVIDNKSESEQESDQNDEYFNSARSNEPEIDMILNKSDGLIIKMNDGNGAKKDKVIKQEVDEEKCIINEETSSDCNKENENES